IDGKLIAANAMGLCAYFDYDQTHARLTERMNHAPLEERVELLQQRGELAFNTFRYPDALNDYTAAEESAKSLPDGEHKRFVLTDLRQRRCRTYVALGNREKDADKALSWFAKAQDLARTKQQRAHMRIRTAKLLEWFGRFPEAVEVAQALGEEFPEEQVVDVRVGADVNPREIFSDSDPILPAKAWAHQFIRRILKIHGQDVYAKFDDRARRALQQARQENTPEAYLAIQRRWPVSKHVPDAYFAAAEVYYARAKQTEDAARADENLRQCVDLLQQVVHHRDNSHWPSTLAALTAVYTADGRVVLASQTRMELDDLPPDTPIAFADLQGPLDTILRDLDEGKIKTIQTPKTKTPEKTLPVLNPPLREIFRLDDSTTRLLFDTNGNPLRLGNIVFVQQGDEILLLDTSAAGAENAVRAAALTKIRYSRGQNFYVGISRHGNIVAVANNQRVSVFQTDTCKLLRQEDWSHYGFRDVMSVGVGDDRIVVLDAHSRMKVIDIATGEVRWKYPPKEPRRGKLPPAMPIEVRAPEAQRGNGRAPNIRVSLIPQIADGLIMAPMYTGDGVYGVFDINSGKLLLSHIAIPRNELQRFSGHIQGQLLGDDRLVIAVNGKLTLYDLKNAKKPVLETTVHTSRDVNGNLLGWNRDFLAVRGPKNNVLVYSLRDPTRNPTALSLSLPKIKGELVPQTAILDEQRVYVFVSRDIAIQALPDRIRFKGLAVTAFDLSSGKQLWSRIPLSMEAYSKLNHTETRRYLVLDLWPSDIQGQCLLIEKATGRIAQRLAITENHYDGKVWHFHRRAVVTNGRLVVENLKGIAVYGQ
ncbi:MAG: PQQ-binding-like beta-propeller repeat protein, partial [Phycisphaerae bacterium]|nr:PQQ-binding-like beta-propeller repeat protein [Phycisphaerae bacterium]